MKGSAKSSGLLRRLHQLLPDSELSVVNERTWHSVTFSGVQVCISVILHSAQHADCATCFEQALPEHEFDLCGQLVADIAVIETVAGENQHRLMIDALILDD